MERGILAPALFQLCETWFVIFSLLFYREHTWGYAEILISIFAEFGFCMSSAVSSPDFFQFFKEAFVN